MGLIPRCAKSASVAAADGAATRRFVIETGFRGPVTAAARRDGSGRSSIHRDEATTGTAECRGRLPAVNRRTGSSGAVLSAT